MSVELGVWSVEFEGSPSEMIPTVCDSKHNF